MRGFSKVILAGNLTRDPELRTTPSGAQVCAFGLAVNRVYRGANGEQQESVSFFDCSVWGKQGETVAQYAHKGDGIIVSGRLDQRSWDDKQTGQKRTRVEVVVEDFNFLGRGAAAGGEGSSYGGASRATSAPASAGASSASAPAAETVPEDIPDDVDLTEIPF